MVKRPRTARRDAAGIGGMLGLFTDSLAGKAVGLAFRATGIVFIVSFLQVETGCVVLTAQEGTIGISIPC